MIKLIIVNLRKIAKPICPNVVLRQEQNIEKKNQTK